MIHDRKLVESVIDSFRKRLIRWVIRVRVWLRRRRRLDSLRNVIHAGNSLDLRHNLRRLCEIFDRTLWSTITRESEWSIRGRLCHTILWNSNRIEPRRITIIIRDGWLCGFSLVRYWETLLLYFYFLFFTGLFLLSYTRRYNEAKKRTFRSLLKIDLIELDNFRDKIFLRDISSSKVIQYGTICNIFWFLSFGFGDRIVQKEGLGLRNCALRNVSKEGYHRRHERSPTASFNER